MKYTIILFILLSACATYPSDPRDNYSDGCIDTFKHLYPKDFPNYRKQVEELCQHRRERLLYRK